MFLEGADTQLVITPVANENLLDNADPNDLLTCKLKSFGFDSIISKALKFLDEIRFNSGGYPARNPNTSSPSATTTAVICIAREKAGVISRPFDQKTTEDINFILSRFDREAGSCKYFDDGRLNPWTTAFCIWALSILSKGDLDCVNTAVIALIDSQKDGCWKVSSKMDNGILVSYMVVKALITYYSKINQNERIKRALELAAGYFEVCLYNNNLTNLNVTDCALAFQGIYDIYSSHITDHLPCFDNIEIFRARAISRLHELITNKGHTEKTRIVLQDGSKEWPIYHFHPAVLPIIFQHNGDALDVFELLRWFTDEFKTSDGIGNWEHFANTDTGYPDNTYITALAIYSLCDFLEKGSFVRYFEILHKRIIETEQENVKLKSINSELRRSCIHGLWNRYIVDNKEIILIISILGITGLNWIYDLKGAIVKLLGL